MMPHSIRSFVAIERAALVIAIGLGVASCQSARFQGTLSTNGGTAINSATFCEIMASQGGPILWSSKDTRFTKERIDQLNAVWKQCDQYKRTERKK
jgi:hypothetical protein